ncbi:MAG: tripartite tricarboxylate transporter substrate binding protein [Alphaproteobacteria bacterium]|nr:tripartite tricarboxylate transporter substrate binding protein [Alphaproteobacteria bacterium]
MQRRTWLGGAAALAGWSMASWVQAQSFSGRTLKFMVGYPVGGVADFITRTTTDGLGATLGANVVVENRPGAAGNIAVDAVMKASPDSGTFGMFGNLQITMNPHVSQLALKGSDPLRDLVPVIGLADMILMLAVTAPTGIKTLDQFMRQARDKGPDFRIGIAGIGAPHHLAVLLLQKNAELNMTMVPYKGGPPMMADAAGGHLDAVITTLPVGSPMVAAGKLNWIATVPATPIPSLPGLPSLAQVLKGETVPTGNGIYAPPGTPTSVAQEMHNAMRRQMDQSAIVAKLRANGLEPVSGTRAEFAAKLQAESVYMKDFLAKVKVDFSS